ncbi:MAG: response regulator [Dysgonomonas sp.]
MKKKILLLDDKESIAKIIRAYLWEEYEIIYFEDPIKGIGWLESGNIPDLVISDIKMPNMTGDDFLVYFKNNGFYKDIPFIILSCVESSAERIRLLENGADDYIVKPFNPEELKVRLTKILK